MEDEKNQNLEKHNTHLLFKDVSRLIKERDKQDAIESNGSITAACFDFQKILTCPNADVSVLYYKRKFQVFNFTIYDMGMKEAICSVWDDSIAKKGANEVCSCLVKFIMDEKLKGVKDFRF